MNVLSYYLMAVNILGLVLMYSDKNRAKRRQYRISENTLWFIAIIGGAIGELVGMHSFRHKTKHSAFKWGLPLLSLVDIVFIIWFLS